MDSLNILGQALECSVCLEQLDVTSRVLPCQHTFCQKCLLDIKNSKKELRCPECRSLVTVPLESLPTNIILIRILEELKTAASPTSESQNLKNALFVQNGYHNKKLSNIQTSSTSFDNNVGTSGDFDTKSSLVSNSLTSSLNCKERHGLRFINDSENVIFSNLGSENNSANPVTNYFNFYTTAATISTCTDSKSSYISTVTSYDQSKNPFIFCQNTHPAFSSGVQSQNLPTTQLESVFISSNTSSLTHSSAISNTPLSYGDSLPENSIAKSSQLKLKDLAKLFDPLVSSSTTAAAIITNSLNSSTVTNPAFNLACSIVKEPTTNHTHIPTSSATNVQDDNVIFKFQAVALFDFKGNDKRDLSLKKGDVVNISKNIDNNWYLAEFNGCHGIVPISYMKILDGNVQGSPKNNSLPLGTAIYDFKVPKRNEVACLNFVKGDVITILKQVDSSWAEGKLNFHTGIFPISFIQLNDEAKSFLEIASSGSNYASKSFVVDDVSRPNSNDSRKVSSSKFYVAHFSYSPRKADELELIKGHFYYVQEKCKDGWFKGKCLSSEKTGVFPGNYVSKLKQESLGTKDMHSSTHKKQGNNHNNGKTSGNVGPSKVISVSKTPILPSRLKIKSTQPPNVNGNSLVKKGNSNQPAPLVRERYRCVAPYPAMGDNELDLQLGDVIYVHKKMEDGWYKGTLQRTMKAGIFPSSFVQRFT